MPRAAESSECNRIEHYLITVTDSPTGLRAHRTLVLLLLLDCAIDSPRLVAMGKERNDGITDQWRWLFISFYLRTVAQYTASTVGRSLQKGVASNCHHQHQPAMSLDSVYFHLFVVDHHYFGLHLFNLVLGSYFLFNKLPEHVCNFWYSVHEIGIVLQLISNLKSNKKGGLTIIITRKCVMIY